jgi:hypothetical protein
VADSPAGVHGTPAPRRRVTQFGEAPPPVPRAVSSVGPVVQRPPATLPVSPQPSAPLASNYKEPAPVPNPASVAPEKKTGRRIVGMLITYTWMPEGQIFPVREGRNLIGRNPDCDISLPDDQNLSDTNSHITYRRHFTVGDLVSMGGTDLNGCPVEENFVKLPNYARVRAGSTHFVFVTAEPPAASSLEV